MKNNIENKQTFKKMVDKTSPKPNLVVNCIKAFLVGGAICTLGQWILNIYESLEINKVDSSILTSMTLIFLGVFFTAINVYDILGEFAGAGSIIPITGFANSIASPAMEYKKEGYILGVGAKMFTIAGPVLVYGTIASVFVGLIYFLFTKGGA